MAFNAITTEDGYFYTEQRNGSYSDGDVEFDYNTGEVLGLVWQFFNGFYCADGDGLVTVQPLGDHFILAEQGDNVSVHHTLREALFAAQALLISDYAAAYADISA